MQWMTRRKLTFSVCVAALALAAAALADDKDSASKLPEGGKLEESIHQSLREIIDHGADIYNKQGDWNGCYRLWEGSLMSLRPLVGSRAIRSWAKPADANNPVYMEAMKGLQTQLGDHPSLKEIIDASLTSARQAPQLHHRAFILRVALDQLRSATRPPGAVEAREKKPADAGFRKEIVEPKQAEEKDKKAAEKKNEEKKNPVGKASVQGNVTYKGALLAEGTVTFESKDGKAVAKIAADGTFKFDGIKPDAYKVAVKGAQGVPLPAKYGNPETSGLTYNVLDGKQQYNIALQ